MAVDNPVGEFDLYLPEELEQGAYAQAFAVWHTPYDFTIDFAAIQLEEEADDGVRPARVVSRVRLPPGVMYELMAAINQKMTEHEAAWGEIDRPRRRDGEGE
jgi:hypothetical protein